MVDTQRQRHTRHRQLRNVGTGIKPLLPRAYRQPAWTLRPCHREVDSMGKQTRYAARHAAGQLQPHPCRPIRSCDAHRVAHEAYRHLTVCVRPHLRTWRLYTQSDLHIPEPEEDKQVENHGDKVGKSEGYCKDCRDIESHQGLLYPGIRPEQPRKHIAQKQGHGRNGETVCR